MTANKVPGGVQFAESLGRHKALPTDEVSCHEKVSPPAAVAESAQDSGRGARATVVKSENHRATHCCRRCRVRKAERCTPAESRADEVKVPVKLRFSQLVGQRIGTLEAAVIEAAV